MKRLIKNLIIALAVPLLALGINVRTANATSYNITGTVRDSNNTVLGAYVYATAASSAAILYGAVSTNINGVYSLPIGASGTYDIHYIPVQNKGYGPIVDSGVSVTTNQVINHTFSSQTNTISGTLADGSGNPLVGATVKLGGYQSSTNSTGYYSISAPAGNYPLGIIGSMPGVYSFTLQQPTSGINLLTGNQILNLSIKTANMTIAPYTNGGQLLYGGVSARATSGITLLYAGDPGTNIILSNSNGATAAGGSVVLTTIVGSTYTAPGLEAASSSASTSICEGIPTSGSLSDCLRIPLTVMGDVSFDLPSASPALRTFSGTLIDTAGMPIQSAQISLIKYGDQTASVSTDASGHFIINALPKKYYLKLSTPGNLDGISGVTLTQSSSNPTIDLTQGDISQNLQLQTATLTISAFDSTGYPDYSAVVEGQTNTGTAHLYSGDPGESIAFADHNILTTSTNNVVTLGSIVGASYSGRGYAATFSGSGSGSLCATIPGTSNWNCLGGTYVVTGDASINVPY